jgi:hypothetical protein
MRTSPQFRAAALALTTLAAAQTSAQAADQPAPAYPTVTATNTFMDYNEFKGGMAGVGIRNITKVKADLSPDTSLSIANRVDYSGLTQLKGERSTLEGFEVNFKNIFTDTNLSFGTDKYFGYRGGSLANTPSPVLNSLIRGMTANVGGPNPNLWHATVDTNLLPNLNIAWTEGTADNWMTKSYSGQYQQTYADKGLYKLYSEMAATYKLGDHFSLIGQLTNSQNRANLRNSNQAMFDVEYTDRIGGVRLAANAEIGQTSHYLGSARSQTLADAHIEAEFKLAEGVTDLAFMQCGMTDYPKAQKCELANGVYAKPFGEILMIGVEGSAHFENTSKPTYRITPVVKLQYNF